jgi:hypothetical protein
MQNSLVTAHSFRVCICCELKDAESWVLWVHELACRTDAQCLCDPTYYMKRCKNHSALGKASKWALCPRLSCSYQVSGAWYTQSNKNPSAWSFQSPEPEVTWRTIAIIIRVILPSPYLCIRSVSLSSVHYNQSHHVHINWKEQYICLISN